MLATTNGELWLLSTPHGARGFFYNEWMAAESSWERVSVIAENCPRIVPEFLAEERRSLGEHRFRQEYCCEFLDDGQSAFPTTWIQGAFQRWPRAAEWRFDGQFCICVDLGQQNDPTAIIVLERWDHPLDQIDYTTYQRLKVRKYGVRSIERVPLGTSYVHVVERIFSLARQWSQLGRSIVALDATGVGAPVLDMLRFRPEARVIPVVFTSGGHETFSIDRYHVPKRDLVQNLALILESGHLQIDPTLPEAELLRRELQNLKWNTNDTFTTTTHDDLAMALAIGLWWQENTERCAWPASVKKSRGHSGLLS